MVLLVQLLIVDFSHDFSPNGFDFDHHGILAPISFARAFRYIDFDT